MTSVSHIYNKSTIGGEFYTYWDELPQIKTLNPAQFKKIRQKIRSAIIAVLTEGLEDHDESTSITRTRRVLSANEMKAKISKILGSKIKKANLYFHLHILEELGVVRIVFSITNNKRITAYYGRTAKTFLLSGKKEKKELYLLKDSNFLLFLKKMNPRINEKEIQAVLDNIMKIGENETTQIVSWMEKYGSSLQDSKVDFVKFFELTSFLKIHNPDVRDGLNKISKLLFFE